MPARALTTIAKHLTAKERVGLSCAAADIDHAAVGILPSTMQTLDVRGLVARDTATCRYVLTDTGRAVLGVLLERGIRPEEWRPRAGPESGRLCVFRDRYLDAAEPNRSCTGRCDGLRG